jgi:type IV secretory pathway VirB2 component (pilin)
VVYFQSHTKIMVTTKPRRHTRSIVATFAATTLSFLAPAAACAGSPPRGTLPWDQPLNTVAALLTGPIAHTFIAFALTVAFLIYGIQGNCEPARRLLKAGLTTAGAVEAVKLLNYLLPY